MMIRTKLRFTASAVVACAAFAIGATDALAQSMTISFATNTAPNNMRGEAESIFIEELEKASNGDITVVPYWGSSLMEGSEILGGVRDGVADMGFVNINYYPNQLLVNSAFNLFPKGPTTYDNILWAYDQMYEKMPQLNAEFAGQGQRIVYKYAVTPYAGAFKSPFAGLEDMRGLRVRAASRWYLNMLDGAGATPVSLPWGDVYQGLQNGTIDGVFTNIDAIHRASLDEAGQNIFFMPDLWLAVPFNITMNEDKYQALSDEHKEAFATAEAAARARFSSVWDSTIADILKTQEEAGYTIVRASAADVEAFTSLPDVKANQERWVKEAKAAGVKTPEKILKGFAAVISEGITR
jgi:TRAP-type C4-dicarboxylate transport system substrate-binding protein